MPFYKNANLISSGGGSLTPGQIQAVDDYINTDYIRAFNVGPQTITTAGEVIELGSVIEGNGITYDSVRESVTFSKKRVYEFSLLINAEASGAFTLDVEIWAEFFNGTIWQPFTSSGQRLSFFTFAADKKVEIQSVLTVDSGFELRFKARTTNGTATLGGTPFDVDGTDVDVLASVLAVSSVGPELP